jgi:hypothetical protein
LPPFRLRAPADGFLLELQNDWLAKHPLTAVALSEETAAWQRVGQVLSVKHRNLERDA